MIKENEIIKVIDDGQVEYIQFKKLLNYKNINHAYILKTHDMNFRVGKDFRHIESVKEKLKTVCENVGFKYETLVRPDYNHSNNVSAIDKVVDGPELKGERFINTDGLATDKKDITIVSTNADCNLLLMYDPINDIIANVHAGWRGTFDRIAENAVKCMASEYNCNPENIEVYFLPSIRKCHFEVDADVKDLCEEKFSYTRRLDEIISKGEIKEGKQKYFMDTVLINKILLNENGIKDDNIIDCGICSVCEGDKVHSKRVEGDFFGLGTALICKK